MIAEIPGETTNGLLLKQGDKLALPINFLPQGDFEYSLKLINSFEEKTELLFSLVINDKTEVEETLSFESITYERSVNFSVSDQVKLTRNAKVFLFLRKGSVIKAFLPMTPRAIQKIENIFPDFSEICEKINLEIDLAENEENMSVRQYSTEPVSSRPAFDEKQIEELVFNRFFKGTISINEAQKQMDYVVYNKTFVPDGSKGFTKLKRAVYRRVVKSVYRRLTKNSYRKAYFAKLYRNYVNNNIISENIRD